MSRGQLYLVRHGESMGNVWPQAYRDDNRNFLSPYGVMQAQLCGHYFNRMGITFESVVSSDLTRSRHTTATILHEMDWKRSWKNEPMFNEVFDISNTQERVKEIKIAFSKLLDSWQSGNLLLVTHYYVMQILFSELVEDLVNIDSERGCHVPNAVPFVWNPQKTSAIKLLDLSKMGDQH